jgi:hypothetical protein
MLSPFRTLDIAVPDFFAMQTSGAITPLTKPFLTNNQS